MNYFTISEWQQSYETGTSPRHLLDTLLARLHADHAGSSAKADHAWISLISHEQLSQRLDVLEALRAALPAGETLPLYGIPFAVKDNIDVAGLPTTAACPAFAYLPQSDADVVAVLVAAGAIPLGKTNMDQFATGLAGTRSPHGAVSNSIHPDYVSGGSSSGSAVVVAKGRVPFSLGTDTAGSGRVPAGLNNIVGLKPTRGALSLRGVVPACKTLDTVSVFALTVTDAACVMGLMMSQTGLNDVHALPRPSVLPPARFPAMPVVGIPAHPEFYGDMLAASAYTAACEKARQMGCILVELDFEMLDRIAALLYTGPWVAERHAAVKVFAEQHGEDMDPVVRSIILGAAAFSATDLFEAQYQLKQFQHQALLLMQGVDALLVPTAPTHYRTADVIADPVRLNSRLGRYTNFVNFMGWSALSLPASIRSDGLPFGVTLIGREWMDSELVRFGQRWQEAGTLREKLPYGSNPVSAFSAPCITSGLPLIPEKGWIRLAVVGAHLSGMPLNHELTSRHAVLVGETRSAACYRLYALPGTVPPKPGLVRDDSGNGTAIVLEVWQLDVLAFGAFTAGVPAPLGIGNVELADGSRVKGFICEPYALDGATDISSFGGWRAYQAFCTVPSD